MVNIKKEKPTDQEPLDENGLKHGEWVGYFHNGKIDYRWNFVHGVRHGFFEGYQFGGRLMYRGYYDMGKEIGYWYYGYKPNEYYLCLI